METRKRSLPASPEKQTASISSSAEADTSSEDAGMAKKANVSSKVEPSVTVSDNTSKGDESAESTPRSQLKTFVPKYEPIQTRKRAKTMHGSGDKATSSDVGSVEPSSVTSLPSKVSGPTTPKVTRQRRTKDEVLTPDTGPRPKAVPKSLLILEPELLPRNFKKKQERLASAVRIHTSAQINKQPPGLLSPAASKLGDGGPSASKDMASKPVSDVPSALLLAAAESERAGQGRRMTVTQGEDGLSYIVTAITSTEETSGVGGQLSTPDAASSLQGKWPVACAVGAEPIAKTTSSGSPASGATGSSGEGKTKSDTHTSLLLLAEAANPSSAGPQNSSVTMSVAQSPIETSAIVTATTADNYHPASGESNIIVAKALSPSKSHVVSTSTSGDAEVETNSDPAQLATESTDSHWTCSVCGEVMGEGERAQHLTQHLDEEEEEEHVCDVCGEQLKDEEELELHMAVEHDQEEGDHGRDFEEEDESGNEQTETAEPPPSSSPPPVLTSAAGTPIHTCQLCGETFRFAAYLRQHTKDAHSETGTVYTCSICPQTFTSKTALDNHRQLHQTPGGSISFKCIRCSENFSSAGLLSGHARTCVTRLVNSPASKRGQGRGRGRGRGRGQGGGRMSEYACNICNKTFRSNVYLEAHQLSHQTAMNDGSGSKALELLKTNAGLQCLYCPQKFRLIGPLKEHILACHPKAFPFKCRVCQRGFSRDSSRIAHEHTHQTEKLYFCTECGEGFTLQTYLNRHMKYRHLKLTKYPCRVCKKEFVRRADLIKHVRVHTGEKPYTCEQCGYGFGQQSNYRYHMMRHRGEKPQICPICNKGFRVPSHLKMHMQQHLNERFVCNVCEKVFSQSRYLQRHMRTHNVNYKQLCTEHLSSASAIENVGSGTVESVMYDSVATSQPIRTEQQIIVDSVGDVTEHLVVQDATGDSTEPVIEFIINNNKDSNDDNKKLSAIDAAGSSVDTDSGTTADVSGGEGAGLSVQGEEAGEGEQAYVNADEGTSVVVGAFSEGEGGSVEEGNVTLPFKDLTQLLGGKHYNCDVCAESFSIRPNSTYNMIHTGHSHILVISLNDHKPEESA